MKKVITQIFDRRRYKASSSGSGLPHAPPDRDRMAKMLGAASRLNVHVRVYDFPTSTTLTFAAYESSFSNEMPNDGSPLLPVTINVPVSAALPWDSTDVPPPGDGWFYFEPHYGLVDLVAFAGGANTYVDFEVWATLEFWP